MLHLKCFFFPLLLGVDIGRTEIRTRLLRSLKGPSFVTKKNVGQKVVFLHVTSRVFWVTKVQRYKRFALTEEKLSAMNRGDGIFPTSSKP